MVTHFYIKEWSKIACVDKPLVGVEKSMNWERVDCQRCRKKRKTLTMLTKGRQDERRAGEMVSTERNAKRA